MHDEDVDEVLVLVMHAHLRSLPRGGLLRTLRCLVLLHLSITMAAVCMCRAPAAARASRVGGSRVTAGSQCTMLGSIIVRGRNACVDATTKCYYVE